MKNQHKIFSLPKPLFWLLVISNVAYAFWLNYSFGSHWSWNIVDIEKQEKFIFADIYAVGQFVLLAITIDATIRKYVVHKNQKDKNGQIPTIFVQAISLVAYGIIALFGYIALYDHTASQILAASGAVGFGAAYVLRESIAGIVACIQIQSQGLLSIGDHIQLKTGEYYTVKQLDSLQVALQDILGYTIYFPNQHFITQDFINISKQHPQMGRRLMVDIELDSGNDPEKVLELLNQAAQYVSKNEKGFSSWHIASMVKVHNGFFIFELRFEADPSISLQYAKTAMNLAIARFLRLGGINLNSTMETYDSTETQRTIKSRLINGYRLGVLKVLHLDEIAALFDVAKITTCRAGQRLIEKGQSAKSMYFLVEGELEVTVPNEEGQEVVVGSVWPGDCVGEMSLLTGDPRSANVHAKSHSTLLEITKEDIMPIFTANPELINEISVILENRKASNRAILNGPLKSEEIERGVNILVKKILKYFFNNEQ